MPVGAAPAAGAKPGAEAAALSGVLPDLAASTSDLTTRPLGPDPAMAETSMPASLARRRARGEAKTLPPSDFSGAGAVLGALVPLLLLVACVAVFSRMVVPASLLGASALGASAS